MSFINKGIIAIVSGVFALSMNVFLIVFHIRLSAMFTLGVPFLLSVLAIYLGIQARKGDARIVGLTGLVLGIIGVALVGFAIILLVIVASFEPILGSLF